MAKGGFRTFAAIAATAAFALSTIAGCAHGIDHRVRRGENLYRIGKAYGFDYQDLARINRIPSPYEIRPGDTLFIPDAERQLPVTVITPRAVSAAKPARLPSRVTSPPASRPVSKPSAKPHSRVARAEPARSAPAPATSSSSSRFAWPAQGTVSSSFGKRAGGHHDGVDIAATHGSPVLAARQGKVIFSDRLSGYGNVIILEHDSGFTTVYAHNYRNMVAKGQRVSRGQRIATIGASGRATEPHLHFEVRKDNVARNPLYYLKR